jgi:precorrin-3B synthase
MSTRRGACPALSAPMRTGDGLLIRLSPVDGGLSPKQLIGLCDSASRHGNGTIEITARGSFQFRGFSDASAALFADEVDRLGISVRTGVPVEVSPLAGMDPHELANPVPVADAIRREIGVAGLAPRLGPKVSVVVDGGGQISLDAISADVRLVANHAGGGTAWSVSIAGNDMTATRIGSFGEAEAVRIALKILTEIATLGRDARAANLLDSGHLQRFSSALPPSVLPHGRRQQPHNLLSLTDNRHALPISLPFGHTDAAALAKLGQVAEATGISDIRPAPDRTLLLICDRSGGAETMRQEAKRLAFITDRSDPRKNIAACPGAPACASGKIAARAIATELAETLEVGTDLSIHVSGCEKGCARQAVADIAIVGGENGAGLVVNGTPRSAPLAYRSTAALPQAVAAVAKVLEVRKAALARAHRAADKPHTLLSANELERLVMAFKQAVR